MDENRSHSGIPLRPFYGPQDVEGMDYQQHLNDPAVFPFTRGIRLNQSKNGAWIQRELSGEGSPATSNRQLKYLLEKGQTGIDVIGDSPTMSWLDPDHPMGRASVGTQGVSICRMEDYFDLYEGIPLGDISVSNSLPAPFAIAGLFLTARHQGVPAEKLRGSVVQFILYGEDCSYAIHLPLSMRTRLAADCIRFCTSQMPRFHSFLEDTYFFSESGLDSVEEMALGFVEIRYLVRHLLRQGVAIDTFAPRIAILLNCKMDFFEEIAKIRATRKLYARMMRDEFGAKDPRSQSVVVASHTSGLTMTAEQPFNNIPRGALQAMALALAGVQAVEISAFDEAYRTPSPEAHLVGLRTQQIIQSETNINHVTNPLGGSYFVEALTDQMEKRIWAMVEEIEARGDPEQLCEEGYFRNIFVNAMERYARRLEEKSLLKVGVNIHRIPEEEDTLLKNVVETKFNPDHEHLDKIIRFKAERSGDRVQDALRHLLKNAGEKDADLLTPILNGFEHGATMGEMVGTLRVASGHPYDPFNMITPPCELKP